MAADALLRSGLMVGEIRTPPSTSSSPNRKLGLLPEPWVLTWACDGIRCVLVRSHRSLVLRFVIFAMAGE
ncbi:hypothetical protein ACFX12_036447 [Malus domestica]